MPVRSLLSFSGFMLLLAATYCPLLRPFGLANMDLYDMNKPFGMVVLLTTVTGILGIVLKQIPLARFCAWLSLLLVIMVYIAAVLKVYHAFNFIPFNSLSRFLSRQIKFKWGWYLMFAGPVIAIAGIFTTKKNISAA